MFTNKGVQKDALPHPLSAGAGRTHKVPEISLHQSQIILRHKLWALLQGQIYNILIGIKYQVMVNYNNMVIYINIYR